MTVLSITISDEVWVIVKGGAVACMAVIAWFAKKYADDQKENNNKFAAILDRLVDKVDGIDKRLVAVETKQEDCPTCPPSKRAARAGDKDKEH